MIDVALSEALKQLVPGYIYPKYRAAKLLQRDTYNKEDFMKCPKCKKPSDLYTKKTLANGREVVRKRFCRKCKNGFFTIERFEGDIVQHDGQYEGRIQKLKEDNQSLESQRENYRDIFRAFKKAMDGVNAKR